MNKLFFIILVTISVSTIRTAQETPDYFKSIITSVKDPNHLIHEPAGIVISPDGKYGYIIHSSENEQWIQVGESGILLFDKISIIDLKNNSVIKTFPNLIENQPQPINEEEFDFDNDAQRVSYSALAVRPDLKYAYATSSNNNSLYVLDLQTQTITNRITDVSFNEPYELCISPDSKYAYVINRISVESTGQNSIEGENALPSRESQNSISVVDLTTNKVIKSVPLNNQFNFISNLVKTKDGRKAYIAAANKNNASDIALFCIDLSLRSMFKFASVNNPASSSKIQLAISSDDNLYLVGNYTIHKINLTTKTVTHLFSSQWMKPIEVAISPDNNTMRVVKLVYPPTEVNREEMRSEGYILTFNIQNDFYITEKIKLGSITAAAITPDCKKAYTVGDTIQSILFPLLPVEKLSLFEKSLLSLIKSKKILTIQPTDQALMTHILRDESFVKGIGNLYLNSKEYEQLKEIITDARQSHMMLYAAKKKEREDIEALQKKSAQI